MAVRDIAMAAAGALGADKIFVEDVFQSWLYTGNGSTQTITNGIDLAGEGGLVWLKYRGGGNNPAGHYLYTPELPGSGGGYYYKHLQTNSTSAAGEGYNALTAFNSNGFSLGGNTEINYGNDYYASWTFRKAEKFFDVVTYTGTGSARTVAHNLGSTPGVIICKDLTNANNWCVYHRSLGATKGLYLNSTTQELTSSNFWNDTSPTSTEFTLGPGGALNGSGSSYVAYLFAHDAGGFGDSGEENVISCGSFTTDGSGNATVDLGWEPQWTMIKRTNSTGPWNMYDNMRGWSNGGDDQYLQANSSAAEDTFNIGHPTATEMYLAGNSASSDYIYIAIRRGPMKTPESGTEVFNTSFAQATAPWMVSGFPMDAGIKVYRPGGSDHQFASRLTGTERLFTNTTAAGAANSLWKWDYMNGYINSTGATTDQLSWNFRRAPGFFDVVCYTGTGSATTVSHNLGVAPEMMIVKRRDGGGSESWVVQHSGLTGGIGQGVSSDVIVYLQSINPEYDSDGTFNFSPTASTFSLQNNANAQVNASGGKYVAYLFASCPGVSKVGSYTGNGSTQTINCGFSGGARFVLIKRTDANGNWTVFDTSRGINAGDDPTLYLNRTDAEQTAFDLIDATASGFIINEVPQETLNESGATYIYLAIA